MDTLTPVPENPEVAMTMSFFDALKAIQAGKRVARISWGNNDYCVLKDGFLSIFIKGEMHTWAINDGDMEGQDWIVVTELN
jgi:hypothetical protein